MTDINLTWENPASSLGIKEFKIFKISGDYTDKNHTVFIQDSTLLATVPMTAPNVVQTYVDTNVESGTFTYGVFSSNNLGLGPGDLLDTAVVVIPPITLTATPGYVDYHALSWAISYDGDIEEYTSFTYELSTSETEFDENIVETETVSSPLNDKLYNNLARQQNYFFRVKAQGLFTAYSEISGSHTDPCTEFSASRTQNEDGTFSLTITVNNANEAVFVSEDLRDIAVRGLVRPIANDQAGNLWLAVGESIAFNSETGIAGGRLVFDTGFLKYFENVSAWNDAYGEDLYASTVPGQLPFMANAIKYTSRAVNPSNKVLFFNDDSQRNPTFNYETSQFVGNFTGITDFLGKELFYFKDETGDAGHYNWIIDNDAGETVESYLNYFNQFDVIIYAGTDVVTEPSYLSNNFITALLDYVDEGGGLIITTDHDIFHTTVNPIVENYGIQFTGNIDRATNTTPYRVSTILANSAYIPGGFHPLFENMAQTSYIRVAHSEGVLVYYDKETGLTSTDTPVAVSRTSQYDSGPTKSITVTHHTDATGSEIGPGRLIVRTASGCGEEIAEIPAESEESPDP